MFVFMYVCMFDSASIKFSKKCDEMRQFLINMCAKTLQNIALKFGELRLNFVRNTLKCTDFSRNAAPKPYIIMH